jgi:hypothetical protein
VLWPAVMVLPHAVPDPVIDALIMIDHDVAMEAISVKGAVIVQMR